MTRVLASAIVDQIRGGVPALWEVKVTGLAPHDRSRTYAVEALSDNAAAQRGIGMFCDEMDCLDPGDD